MTIKSLIAKRKLELKAAKPKSRDRIKHRLNVLLKAKQLKSESRAA